ncbi:MAG: right-handed parallel beta-helix repeat-containing protein, partial [Promethearchaeota archaeon]
MYKGNVSRSSRGRAKYGIRFLLMLFITIGMVLIINHNIVIFTEASAPETGVWVITGTQTYSDHEYNVYYDIIIGDGADVTFSNCKFNFKNSTAVMEIKVNGTAKLRLDGCILNATGNNVYAHISALENSSLTITGSKLVNLGNNNYKGVESQAKYNYIRNNEITGSYNAIYIHQVTDGNVIIRDNMMDSGNYNNYYGIELYKLGNITLTNNTVIGYGTGLYISSIVENLTVEENNIFNTSYSGIYLNDFMSSGHNNWNSYSIRFNKLINTYYGLDVYNGNNGVIMNNSIESISSGISLSYISNLTVSNNKIVCKGKYYGYVGVSMSELTNVSIEHNSLEDGVKIQDESYELKFYSFNDYIKDLNISDNKINGKYALAYYNNQNGTYDFGGMLNIGEIYLYNISNGWLRNANITGASNLKLKNCNNMTISNLHIYNFSSALYISDSHNITLKDSIIGAAYKRIEYEVRVWYGTDIYFDNITLFNHNQSLYSRGMSIEWVNVFHLENSIIDGGYSTGVELSSVNHTLI